MPRFLLFAFLFALSPALVLADQCHGKNLIAALPADQLASITAKAEVPFAHGNLWTATKDGQILTLAGTYHLNDPRFAPILAMLKPFMAKASVLLVEAGSVEEAALQDKIAKDPSLMLLTKGPTLPEQMPDSDWQALSGALKARGIAPFLGAKMQPWLLASMLELPACMFPLSTDLQQGLDKQLMAEAKARGLPVQALEPFDAVLTVFANFSPAEQLEMLKQSVGTDAQSDDTAATLADSYFAGESRLFWEWSRLQMLKQPGMTPDEADRQMALVEAAMMTPRNKAWIPVLEAAAAKGPVVAAFGALHLPGETGVLNLLAERGWTVTPLTP